MLWFKQHAFSIWFSVNRATGTRCAGPKGRIGGHYPPSPPSGLLLIPLGVSISFDLPVMILPAALAKTRLKAPALPALLVFAKVGAPMAGRNFVVKQCQALQRIHNAELFHMRKHTKKRTGNSDALSFGDQIKARPSNPPLNQSIS